jgi:uncharacterized protein YjaZ
VQEGLAELFALEVCGPDSTGAWYAGVTGERFDRTWDTVTAAFGMGRSFADWSPYVLDDPTSARLGRPPVGVPHMGGYAVGRRIVERYLAATAETAAAAIATPTATILEVAGSGADPAVTRDRIPARGRLSCWTRSRPLLR